LIDQELPDAVILDVGLPHMDGLEVARRIRSNPRLNGVRLIALTGYGLASDRRATAQAGFDHHLVKPVQPADLFRAIAPGWVPAALPDLPVSEVSPRGHC
jgi:CheY-like chemotaxis protein